MPVETWSNQPGAAASAPAFAYEIYGLALHSELALPELLPLRDASLPAIRIELGGVPPVLNPAHAEKNWQIAEGRMLLTVRGTARYLIVAPDRILVQPLPGAPIEDVRLFLLGSVLGGLLIRRGGFPLHAGAVRVGGVAVAFTGVSGAGKSTLVAHARQQGLTVLTDDICALEARPDATWAYPGFPRVKLWRDSLGSVDHAPEELVRDAKRLDKFHIPLRDEFVRTPLPLAHVYCLSDAEEIAIEPMSRLAGIASLARNLYRPRLVERLGLLGANFETCRRLAEHTRVWHFRRPKDFAMADAAMDCLYRHWDNVLGACGEPAIVQYAAKC